MATQPLIDRWSGWHLSVGILYGITPAPWEGVLVGSILWELVERPLHQRYPNLLPGDPDSLGNGVADLAFVMIGFLIGRHYRR